jgi:hypothetical protein
MWAISSMKLSTANALLRCGMPRIGPRGMADSRAYQSLR